MTKAFSQGFIWVKQPIENIIRKPIRKHKSDVFHLQNSFCKKCSDSEHLHDCSRMKEPYFRIYPFLYENKNELQEFKEKRFIMR